MSIMIFFVLLITGCEVFTLGLGFHTLAVIIARLLFVLKLFGMDVKIGWMIGFELTALGLVCLWRIVWRNSLFDVNMAVLIVSMIVIIGMLLYDAYFYVYTEEDEI